MAATDTTSTTSFDWNAGAFNLGNTALQGYFSTQIAKENAKALTKTPPASIGIIVLGGVAVLAVLVFALK